MRLVAPDDAETWCALRRALWPTASASEVERDAREYLGGRGALQAVFLCEAPVGDALGMLELSLRSYADGCRSSPVPYVEGWYVVAAARRRGVGRLLVTAAETWACERGYTEIASDALIDNLVSERAHLALGFEEVERLILFRKDLQRSGATSMAQPASRTRST